MHGLGQLTLNTNAHTTEMNGLLSIYLLKRLNPRRGHQTGSGEPSAGDKCCCFFVSYCAMLAVLVVSERRASACLMMLTASKVATGTIFNAFGMVRPGIKPTSIYLSLVTESINF